MNRGKAIFVFSLNVLLSSFIVGSPPIRLGKPEVSKIDWNLRSIVSDDMNNDGMMDLVMINNKESKVEILLQRKPGEAVKNMHLPIRKNRWEPVMEDSHFERESLVSETAMYSLTVGDLNNDGLIDIAYTGKKEPLNIRFQLKEGGFSKGKIYDNFEPAAWTSTLSIVDINNDGLKDLIVLGKENILIFYQDEKGLKSDPISLRLTNEVSYGLNLTDVNGDKKLDILSSK
jgi:hypothetical protein